jgi:CHASE3 domain sensor protein
MTGAPRLLARIALIVGAAAMLVAVGVALLLVNTEKLKHKAQAASRADAYLVSAIDVERLVVDAETGLRGYVITVRRRRRRRATGPRARGLRAPASGSAAR